MPISDENIEKALRYLADPDGEGPEARAAHEYLKEMTKVVLAKLIADSDEKSAVAKENWARCQPAYEKHLEQLKIVAETDYKHRDKKAAASAMIEVWRTQQSNARGANGFR